MDATLYYSIFNLLLISALIGGFIYLLVFAILIHDVGYIKAHPFWFAVEWLVVSLVPALPFFIFTKTRGMTTPKAIIFFWSVAFKFAIFHLLMQLAGYYTHEFGDRV